VLKAFASLGIVLALAAVGCAPSLRGGSAEITKGAVPAAVDTTLDKLQEPKTRQQIVGVVESPEMRSAIIDLSEGVTEGIGQGLGSDAMTANMEKLMRQLARSFMLAMLDSMRTLGPTLERSIKEDLGPALRTSMRDEIGPGIASVLDAPELRTALGHTAQAVAHDAVLGSNAALAELAEKKKHDEGGQPVGTIAALLEGRSYVLIALGVLVFLVLPIVWMLWQLTTVRRYLQQVSGKTPRELRRSLRAGAQAR
jgi:hypothetical protein